MNRSIVLLSLLALGVVPALAQDAGMRRELEELRRSQRELMEMLKENQERIERLEGKVGPEVDRPPPSRPDVPPPETDDIEWVRWNEIVAGKSKLTFYGFLRLDAHYDDSRPNNTQTIGFIRPEDNRTGNTENDDDLTIHARLTRLGIDFDGPTIERLGDAKVTGKLEIDFFNSGLLGQAESRSALRMRHAYLKLGWDAYDLSLLAGQTYDLISPLYPAVNPDLAMWGAGNLGDRRPQLRVEYKPKLLDGVLTVQGSVGLTGAIDSSDLDPAGTFGAGYRDGETSGRPTLQARVAYTYWFWNAKGKLEVGVWGDRAWEDPDHRFFGAKERAEFDSYAYGFDFTIPLYSDRVWVKGEGWTGKNLDDIRGGIFQGINATLGREVKARGGWVEVGAKVTDWYSISVGISADDPDNDDLNPGGRASNKIWYIANRFDFDPVYVGFDYLNWRTNYTGSVEPGTDNRFSFFIMYKF